MKETKKKAGRKPMGMTNIPVGFNKELLDKIRDYASDNCEGNFNMAVRKLCAKSL